MARPFFSTHERRALVRVLRFVIGVGVLVAGVFVAFSLLSHDPADRGFYTATWRDTRNWMGDSGALISDVLIRTIGLAAYGVALMLLLWGWRIMTNRPPTEPLRRLVVAPIALVAGAAFASSHAGEAAVGGGFGGLIGDFVFGVLAAGLPFESPRIRLVASTLSVVLVLLPTAAFALGGRLWDLWSFCGATWRSLFTAKRKAPEWAAKTGRAAGSVRNALLFVFNLVTLRFAAAEPAPASAPLRQAPSAPRDSGGPDFSASPFPTVPRAPSSGGGAVRREPGFEAGAAQPDLFEAPSFEAARPSSFSATDEFSAIDAPPVRSAAPSAAKPARAAAPQAPRPERRYTPPSLELLAPPRPSDSVGQSEEALAQAADQLQAVLRDYGVKGDIVDVNPGPVVSQFELEPAPGLKASRVIGLADDIARSMSATAARISTVPGRNVIGIELPNENREIVRFRELLAHPSFSERARALPLALGKDIAGLPVVADLATMPHLLIAGTTGSGKSVGINTMLLSLLFRMRPDQVRLLMIDPKMLELSVYNDAPHLLAPVITDPKKAVSALKWVVREMESRYQKMSRLNVRSLDSYNQRVAEAQARGEPLQRTVQTGFDEVTGEPLYETQDMDPTPMPYIVVVIDEMADLMLVAGKEIEHCIQRLAQMARASGIHLIMATQRPSVDVITGVIKANFPIRISFQVTSKIDSRTILGEPGAEQLLGKGDMLFASGGGRVQRIHGAFVSDEEVEKVALHLRSQGAPEYEVDFDAPETVDDGGEDDSDGEGSSGGGDEALLKKARQIVLTERRASTSLIQRRLQIGYNRAARLIEMLESEGVISSANHVGKREVLKGSDDDSGF